MRETHEKHKLMRFQAAFEQLMLTAYAMHAVASELFGYLSHATVYGHKNSGPV